MKTRWSAGVCALGLAALFVAGCTEGPDERVGEQPAERPPAASPPTTTDERTPTAPPAGQPTTPESQTGSGTSGTR